MKTLYLILLLSIISCSQSNDENLDLNLVSNKNIKSFKDTTFVIEKENLNISYGKDSINQALVNWHGYINNSALNTQSSFLVNYPQDSILKLKTILYTTKNYKNNFKDTMNVLLNNKKCLAIYESIDSITISDSTLNKIDFSNKIYSISYNISGYDFMSIKKDSILDLDIKAENFDKLTATISNSSRITLDSLNIQPKIIIDYLSSNYDSVSNSKTMFNIKKEYIATTNYSLIKSNIENNSFISNISGQKLVINTENLYDISLNTAKATLLIDADIDTIFGANQTAFPYLLKINYGVNSSSETFNDSLISYDITNYLVNGIKNNIDITINPSYLLPYLFSMKINDIKIKIEASVLDE